jgi:hypothetical protein
MPPADLLQRVRTRPFEAFRIVTTDGTTYDIRHPDLVMIGLGSVVVGFPDVSNPQLYARTHQVSLRHTIRLEPIDHPASQN